MFLRILDEPQIGVTEVVTDQLTDFDRQLGRLIVRQGRMLMGTPLNFGSIKTAGYDVLLMVVLCTPHYSQGRIVFQDGLSLAFLEWSATYSANLSVVIPSWMGGEMCTTGGRRPLGVAKDPPDDHSAAPGSGGPLSGSFRVCSAGESSHTPAKDQSRWGRSPLLTLSLRVLACTNPRPGLVGQPPRCGVGHLRIGA